MKNFLHLSVPAECHPTAAARRALSLRLGLEDNPDFQDWERQFASASRVGEFLRLYAQGDLDENEKFLLMDLILASTEAAFDSREISEGTWRQIEDHLALDIHIHQPTIWFWADIDEETGLPDNSFAISGRMQVVLQAAFERKKP